MPTSTTTHAIRISQSGAANVMQYVEVELAPPAAGELQICHHALGLNYIDVYFRSGLYPAPLPAGLGLEGAGIVQAVGAGVSSFAVGDRVAYACNPMGAYSQVRNMPAQGVVKLPDNISFDTAAAMMLKGMTVQYLLRRTYKVKAGDTILFHAAAGGVGLIACQWARALGVNLIGTAGSDEKCALAKSYGAAHVINYGKEDIVARVKEITGGKGVPVAYDSVGKDTFEKSLECLAPFGTMVSFGNASGPVAPLALTALKGTLYITRPSLMPYTAARADLEGTAHDLFEVVGSGKVKIEINQRYALADVVQAHTDLEARKTTGSTILLP